MQNIVDITSAKTNQYPLTLWSTFRRTLKVPCHDTSSRWIGTAKHSPLEGEREFFQAFRIHP